MAPGSETDPSCVPGTQGNRSWTAGACAKRGYPDLTRHGGNAPSASSIPARRKDSEVSGPFAVEIGPVGACAPTYSAGLRPAELNETRATLTRMPGFRSMAVPLCAVLWSAGACTSTGETTQLIGVAETDMDEVARVSFRVMLPSGDVPDAVEGDAPGPLFLTLWHTGGAYDPVTLTAVGLDASGKPLISRVVKTQFRSGESRTVPLHLTQACFEVPCPEGETCNGEGVCVSQSVDAASLPPWQVGTPASDQTAGTIDAAAGFNNADGDSGATQGDGGAPSQDGGLQTQDGGSLMPDPGGANPCRGVSGYCDGDTHVACASNAEVGREACGDAAFGSCAVGACDPDGGCIRVPANEGQSCGRQTHCEAGVCVVDADCGSDCAPACQRVDQCDIQCPAGSDCTPSCGRANCRIHCNGANTCNPRCVNGATCDIRCAGAADCQPSCNTGASCEIQCGGAGTCIPFCPANASCNADCSGGATCPGRCGAGCTLACGANPNCSSG